MGESGGSPFPGSSVTFHLDLFAGATRLVTVFGITQRTITSWPTIRTLIVIPKQ